MIRGYFGVPGCGKTTLLTKEGISKKNKKKYENIYTINFECSGTTPITFSDLGKYKIKDSLILIDEITMSADNREFKTFPKEIRDFFILHRHLGCDIIYATQNFENVDKKIRDLTHDLWYMSKSVVPILNKFTTAKRIYRNININENTSELTLGYRFCNFLESIFASNFKIILRSKYYKYFDTWDELSIKDRPMIHEKEKTPYKRSKIDKIKGVILNGWRNRKRNKSEPTIDNNKHIDMGELINSNTIHNRS